nr:oligopeptide/dipeptide ABC transporter ATP-binding protein [Peribacillus loiseleuriae]
MIYLGKLVEIATSEELFLHPAHHYTKGLISSVPIADPSRPRELISIQGEIPSPANPPSGCRLHTRCREEQPKFHEV